MPKEKPEFVTLEELSALYVKEYERDGNPERFPENHFQLALLYIRVGRFKYIPSKDLYRIPVWSDFHSSNRNKS